MISSFVRITGAAWALSGPAQPAVGTGEVPGSAQTEHARRAAAPDVHGAPVPHPVPSASHGSRRVRWIGSLGATGIAVGTTGIAAVALGLVFLRKDTTSEPHPTDDSILLVKDYTRPGWVLTGAGMGAYAIGAIALAIDVTVGCERRFRRAMARPQLGHGYAGLQLRYRF